MTTLPIHALENIYDELALAVDQVPAGRTELFLTKLVLLLANETGNSRRFCELLAQAQQNLKGS